MTAHNGPVLQRQSLQCIMQVDFSPYVDILTDELDLLYWEGVDVVNAATDEHFACHAMLLNIVTDYRGMPELFRTAQAPAYVGACYVCGVEGWRMVGNVSKTCYSGECNPLIAMDYIATADLQHLHVCESLSVQLVASLDAEVTNQDSKVVRLQHMQLPCPEKGCAVL